MRGKLIEVFDELKCAERIFFRTIAGECGCDPLANTKELAECLIKVRYFDHFDFDVCEII